MRKTLAAALVASLGLGASSCRDFREVTFPSAATSPTTLPAAKLCTPGEPCAQKRVIALTVSGAVSLGAYQAGYLYYLTEVLKRHRDEVELRLVTGASAGSINGLLALMTTYETAARKPTESLFFRAWVEKARYSTLVEPKNGPLGAFGDGALDAIAELARAEFASLRTGTSPTRRVFGATATRVHARSEIVGGRYSVPRSEEKFALILRGAKEQSGSPIVVEAAALPLGTSKTSRVWIDAAADPNGFLAARNVMLASAAFPVAFSPRAVERCADVNCATHVSESFIDGGVLDNTPVRLAFHLSENAMAGDAAPNVVGTNGRMAIPVLFVNYESTTFPPLETEKELAPPRTLLTHLGSVGASFVAAAAAKELITLVEDFPDLAKAIHVSSRSLPTASGHVFNFLGFLDTNFRAFDFYLGAADAEAFVSSDGLGAMLRPSNESSPNTSTWTLGDADTDSRFRFVRDVALGKNAKCATAEDCPSNEMKLLARSAVARLVSACEATGAYDGGNPIAACSRHCPVIGSKKSDELHRPCERVFDPSEDKPVDFADLRRSDDETDLGHMLRLLDTFAFEDPELQRSALAGVRRRLGDIVDRVVSEQPWGSGGYQDKAAVAVAGHALLNQSLYDSVPRWRGYLAVGNDFGVGGIYDLFRVKDRLHINAEAGAFFIFSVRGENGTALPLRFGVTPELHWPLVQLQFPLLFGVNIWNKYSGDGWRQPESDQTYQTKYHYFGGVRLGFIDRIWVQLGFAGFPRTSSWEPQLPKTWEPSVTGAIQLLWPI